jgi:hypothetical protein
VADDEDDPASTTVSFEVEDDSTETEDDNSACTGRRMEEVEQPQYEWRRVAEEEVIYP